LDLTPGDRIGVYEVVVAIGAGGMGEVYRARDTKLNREVPLKVLPEAVVTDPDRLARFRREAQVLAALNYAHIAHIHGFRGRRGDPRDRHGAGRRPDARRPHHGWPGAARRGARHHPPW
jgi:serine/threonine protein kinase